MIHPTSRPINTISRSIRLRKYFNPNQGLNYSANLARLYVLYEDLRLEITGLTGADPKYALPKAQQNPFDRMASNARVVYFLRKSIGTIREFSECIRFLDSANEFKQIRKLFSAEDQTLWEDSVRYFAHSKTFWQSVRNDLGGHFSQDACRYVVQNLNDSDQGRIELQRNESGEIGFSLPFAWEICSRAFLRHSEEEEVKVKISDLIEKTIEAYNHVIPPVLIIIGPHIWNTMT